MSYGFKTIVTGDYACFSRPEMKVEGQIKAAESKEQF